jgi:hypothetical protein
MGPRQKVFQLLGEYVNPSDIVVSEQAATDSVQRVPTQGIRLCSRLLLLGSFQ